MSHLPHGGLHGHSLVSFLFYPMSYGVARMYTDNKQINTISLYGQVKNIYRWIIHPQRYTPSKVYPLKDIPTTIEEVIVDIYKTSLVK